MTTARNTICPGCHKLTLPGDYTIQEQPIILNYRVATVEDALKIPRRDIRLEECGYCGLIFNAAFDAAVIPYDEKYENRQCFSPEFNSYLENLANDLTQRHQLKGKRILEIGCGKGDFLKLICQQAGASGTGYDTTYDGATVGANLTFHRHYASADIIKEKYDLILCRHVVEHISNIGDFLKELHAISQAAGHPAVVIETPRFEWIAANRCFWDVFYEHCNYFTMQCLANLCALAGFSIVSHREVFGSQYQIIEVRSREAGAASDFKAADKAWLADFAGSVQPQIDTLSRNLRQAGAERGWGVWGAGAKGVTLVNRLRDLKPDFVVDINQAKQGCLIPGTTTVRVVNPHDPKIARAAVILIANPNYVAEITAVLREVGFTGKVLVS